MGSLFVFFVMLLPFSHFVSARFNLVVFGFYSDILCIAVHESYSFIDAVKALYLLLFFDKIVKTDRNSSTDR